MKVSEENCAYCRAKLGPAKTGRGPWFVRCSTSHVLLRESRPGWRHGNAVSYAVALVFFLSIPNLASSQEADMTSAFMKEYEPELKKLLDAYRKIVVKAKRTEEGLPGRQGPKTDEIVYMANGPLQRLELVEDTAANSDTRHTRHVWVATPTYSFTLLRKFDDRPFVLTALDNQYEEQVQRVRLHGVVPFIAYCYFELTFPELVKKSELDFKVQKVLPTTDAETPVVKVNYSSVIPPSPNAPKPFNRVGELTFLSDQFWALKEHSFGSTRSPTAARTSIEYGVSGGKPVVKKVQEWRQHKDGRRTNRVTVDVTDFSFEQVDPAAFSLSAFGLPEPPEFRPGINPAFIWFGLGGAVCVALGVYLRVRQRAP